MASELAKAYVQIVPSAKGIGSKIGEELGNETNGAGLKAGNNIVGKILSVVSVAAIGKAIGSTITAGGALEQSLGGVETLFKTSSSKVIESAKNAYKTAGLSANDYMENVTSFSASLLKSLGGDTAKAADVADMAMRDMADNSNKMGTSMGDIQNAYQGFAKQNYTMLDNLKLGYGGTKTEMQRLLADAQAITGVKYDISNLNDVYSAINVIQEDLGILGATADEASTTITGSFNAMKAAFTNVLGSLALGEDLGPSLSALAETLTTFLVGNIIPALWNIISALPGAIVTFIQTAIPQLVTALMDFVPQMQAGFTASAPAMIQSAGQLLNDFCNGIVQALPLVITKGLEIITNLANSILANLPQIMTMGVQTLISLINGIKASLPQIIAVAGQTIISLVQGLVTHLPQIVSTGMQLIAQLASAILSMVPVVITAAGSVAKNIWNAIKNVDWLSLGVNLVQGLINGIGSMAGALWDAATNIAKSAYNAIKGFLGIASPSKLMRDKIGKFMPLGIAVGINQNTKPVISAMKNIAEMAENILPKNFAIGMSATSGRLGNGSLALATAGNVTNYNQTIYTHDSLSEYELTRQAENFLTRTGWKNP